jgi:transcription elongation factor Elf1
VCRPVPRQQPERIQDDRPRRIKCPHCGGHGLVGVWVGDYEVAECEECGGMGELTVYPNDSVAMYPGGPMRGSWPGAYEKAL